MLRVTTAGAVAPVLLNQEGSLRSALRRAPSPREDACVGHDVHENTSTYPKFEGFAGIRMLLMIKDLHNRCGSCAGKKGNLKMKDDPTMLLKTKEERSDFLSDPTMSMIIRGLFYHGHDMYEKKWT
jgi:hypothetical protein